MTFKIIRTATVILLLLTTSITAETLTLKDCISTSLEQSEKVKASKEGAQAAKDGKNAVIFNFLPTTKFEMGYQWLKFAPEPEPMMFDPGIPGMDPIEMDFELPDKSRTMNITVVEPITPLWSVFNGYKAASLGHDIAEIQAKLTSEQLKMEVINLFYNYQMLTESAEILNKTKEQLERYKTKAQNFVDAGLTDKRAVLKIEIELAKIEQQIMIVDGNIKLIKKNLSIFMNRDVNSFTLQVEKTPSNSLSAGNDTLSDMMKKSRLELKMLNKSNKIAKHLEWTAIQPLIPTLALAGGYSKTWDASTFQPEGTLFIGGSLSWNVGFDWGSAIFNYKKARAERVKTELENIASKKAMEVQLIQLENDVNTKSQAITIAKKEIESAQENLRIEEDKYNQKLTTETDLLDASIAFRSAKLKLLTSIYEHEVALNRLAITIGVPYEEITN